MKKSEIRELSAQELEDKVAEKAEEVANLKFQHALHQLDNTATVRTARRELARLKTILKENKASTHQLTCKTSMNETENR